MITLEGLPWDVLVMIEGSVDTRRDLHSLIAASPAALRAFNANRAAVFRAALQNVFEPLALPHALTIVRVPSLEHIPTHLPEEERSEMAVTIIEPFLDEYFTNRDALKIPTDHASITKLFRLHGLVSRFINEYTTHAARHILEIPDLDAHNPDPAGFPLLSRNEQTRLQRAFLRHELYSRVFPATPDDQTIGVVPARDQFRLFIARLSTCDLEEMCCIHSYTACLVGEVLDDLEERILQAFLAAPGITGLSGARPYSRRFLRRYAYGIATRGGRAVRRHPQNHHWRPPAVVDDPVREQPSAAHTFNDPDRWGVRLFDADTSHETLPSFIASLASLGLEATERLVTGSDDQRKDMIQRVGKRGASARCREHSFPAAQLHCFTTPNTSPAASDSEWSDMSDDDDQWFDTGDNYEEGSDMGDDHEEGLDMGDDDDHPRQPGAGFGRFYDSMFAANRIYGDGADLAYNPLRERGYVFWDTARLGLPAVKRGLDWAARPDSPEGIRSRGRARLVGLQERLRGAEIPFLARLDIISRFGDEDMAGPARALLGWLGRNDGPGGGSLWAEMWNDRFCRSVLCFLFAVLFVQLLAFVYLLLGKRS